MRIIQNPNFNFIRWRWHAIVLSLLIVVGGVATAISRGGLPLGVDFSGGTLIVVKFAQPTTEETVRQALGSVGDQASVQRYGSVQDQSYLIRLPVMEGMEAEANLNLASEQVENALRAANIGQFETINRDIVGPTIGEDLRRKGVWATLTAIGGILVYIGIRFRFAFAIGAVVATFHDILVTLAFLMWFGYDLTLNVVAAFLTIAGYSVNDTIVVFDRIRERSKALRKEKHSRVMDLAVNETLSRTIITSLTVFLTAVALLIWGGEVLRDFSIAMVTGVLFGTFSSVFVASALALDIWISLDRRKGIAAE